MRRNICAKDRSFRRDGRTCFYAQAIKTYNKNIGLLHACLRIVSHDKQLRTKCGVKWCSYSPTRFTCDLTCREYKSSSTFLCEGSTSILELARALANAGKLRKVRNLEAQQEPAHVPCIDRIEALSLRLRYPIYGRYAVHVPLRDAKKAIQVELCNV